MAARDTLPAELFGDIKNHLGITWDDENTDRRILNLAGAGMAYINGKLGAEADYIEDGFPRTLLFEYVRYARDAALDVFENNYTSMILAMRHERQVAESEKTQISKS